MSPTIKNPHETDRESALDLSPARWIWLPSERTLPNTFVLFRREVQLDERPVRAEGWVSADSRYRLSINGRRLQWGPAPCDPRWLEADPVDLTDCLDVGPNVIGAEVLFYGHGDGTWAMGKPGFLFYLELEFPDGESRTLVSDQKWLCHLDRAHPPGRPKRYFVRALQEEFDARRHPHGWDQVGFMPESGWVQPMDLNVPADRPPACGDYPEYLSGMTLEKDNAVLRARRIPLMRESLVPAAGLADGGRVQWQRDPADWFQYRMPDSLMVTREKVAKEIQEGVWRIPPVESDEGCFLTFEFVKQAVGWPRFVIEAPEGTTVETIVQESHDPDGPAWLDSHFHTWSRLICREGLNVYEPFDFESFRWLQLHISGHDRPVTIREVGMRRRSYDWPTRPGVRCDDPELQVLFDAGLNTLENCAQETCVDGMGRERQQYSGDVGHQLHAIRYVFGEQRLPERFLRTYSQGLTRDGYFLDCWPGYDRLARLMERQVDATPWGPLLDHGVGFNFDCWHHYMQTGHLDALRSPYPRLLRFFDYLCGLRGEGGLLPVDNIGVPTVWMDHDAYALQRHKQCAFNLYVSAMMEHALAPVAEAFGDKGRGTEAREAAAEILEAARERFWSSQRGLFVNNLPWAAEEGEIRLCDRSLANSVLFDQCPGGATGAALKALIDCPPEMGLSYPANSNWRHWALARLGRADVVVEDWRERWAEMPSVIENTTIQENWHAVPDSTDQWSHCAVSPLFVLFMDIAGIRSLEPGFERCVVRPQIADLPGLSLTAQTVRGSIHFEASPEGASHRVTLELPAGMDGELLLMSDSETGLESLGQDKNTGLMRYGLPAGGKVTFVQ